MSYRDRVHAIYEAYAPEKVGSVENALKKYEGHEEALIQTLVKRYGPEPQPRTTDPVSPAQGITPSREIGPHDELQHSSSMFFPAPQQQQSLSSMSPPQQLQSDLDRYSAVRAMIRDKGFLCREHERVWEEAWMGKIPLKTYRKDWEIENSLLLDGMGQKLSSHARPIRRWQKRYFALAPPFFYYFEDDKAASVCRGALYMDRAEIEETEQDGKPERRILRITSRVNKKPAELDPDGRYCTFEITFESARQQAMWLAALQQVSQIPPRVGASGAIPSCGSQLQLQSSVPSGVFFPPSASASPPHPVHARQSIGPAPAAAGPARGLEGASAGSTQAVEQPPQKLTVEITANDIKKRVERLVSDRDPAVMCRELLEFCAAHVKDPNAWWHLMNKVEETPIAHGKAVAGVENQPHEYHPMMALYTAGGSGAARVLDLLDSGDEANEAPDGKAVMAAGSQAAAPPFSSSGEGLPSYASPRQRAQDAAPPPANYGRHAPVADSAWQSRLERLKARRSAVERILGDVPGST